MHSVKSVACFLLTALLLSWAGCGEGGEEPQPSVDLTRPVAQALDREPAKWLSSYNLFAWDPVAGFRFNQRVVPYELNTALFSDHALKQRAIYIPEGAAASYQPERAFDFPAGSVVIKNFYFPADFRAPSDNLRLIETRLLVRHADGWRAYPYIWDAAQRDAVFSPAGEVRAISFIDRDGTARVASYLIPQRNQCENCHARRESAFSAPAIAAIGLKARHLNRSHDYGAGVGARNQLEYLSELGMLSGAPAPASTPAAYDFRPIEAGGVNAIPAADVEPAARSYLDINCAHCHEPNAVQGDTSQLFLNHDNRDLFHLGVCKRPGSAGEGNGGLTFDIVPGDPDNSILYFRTHTDLVGAMMPLLGRSLTDLAGAELVRAWIAAMPANNCVAAQ